ncbi:heat shock protein 9/12 [Dioszegia hungarica]|uniref:Heat shock protein 9/12 n=1 Tax=Dioszegia hungarica TaxID=4972 RepID=A0AA38H8R9_9TREE|nr:heat shock protein 9/12 [Dioszegia hungarica]KAI9635511.1 heat shock protein 9/12 [Dioszegia hungarica]
MSSAGRQDFTDKVGAAVKPDSQKSYVEQATDFVKGKLDAAASVAQPEHEKSTTQKIGDAVTGDNKNKNLV